MADLILIQKLPHLHGLANRHQVRLQAERSTLSKRRWRGKAQDGREFGFDLDAELTDGTLFHLEGGTSYVLEQLPEELLEIPVSSVREAAQVGWSLGNLHFSVEVRTNTVRVAPDPAVLQFLEREHISFRKLNAIFLPLSAAAAHYHHHDHEHHHG